MKKNFDAVAFMREAREKLSCEWQGKARDEEIEALHRKFTNLTKKKKRIRRSQ